MKEDLLNQRFGKLVVIAPAIAPQGVKTRGAYWLCKCDCGNEKIIRARNLKLKDSIACGCVWKNKRHQEMRGEYLSNLEQNARRRNLSFEISSKFLWELYEKQNRLCALTGVPIQFDKRGAQTCSLDRIDSSKGYTVDNVQWVHKTVNLMKLDLDQDEFILICSQVSKLHLIKTEQ